MIYTVTLNPAVDYVIRLDHLRAGELNRAKEDLFAPGGKGINVSIVLKNLACPSVALGFVAGHTGAAIRSMLNDLEVSTDFIDVEGFSRVNVKIKALEETEINGGGPIITDAAFQSLVQKVESIPSGSVLVLAGSIPKCLSTDCYRRLAEVVRLKAVRVVVDAVGELLLQTLDCRPWLVKPNREELEETLGAKINSAEEVFAYARKIQEMGAQNVIVSMGAAGAVMVSETENYVQPAFRGKVVDTVGAGDSLVAGFLAAKEAGKSDRAALLEGVASGCASSFRQGLPTKKDIDAILNGTV